MARRPRRNHSSAFKAKVAMEAMEAIRGELTLAELAKKHDVRANQIVDWKRQLEQAAAGVFDKGKTASEPTPDLTSLHAKIGQLMLENDFLKERSARRDGSAQSDD